MDLSQLAIVRCTPAQTVQSRRNHFVQWGQPLGFDEQGWLDRFTAMEKGEWAEDDRYITWALVPRDDPETTDLFAHCETFRRQSVIRDAGSRVKQVISYGIASVYTPANHRSKGYARHILQLVHYLIARESLLPVYPETWGPKPDIGPMDADFSVLYSGIGDKYYATCRQGDGPSSKPGWIRLPLTARTWDVSNAQTATSQEGWQWLGLNDLSGLEEEAAQNLRADFDRDTQGDEASSFAILPSWSLLRIHALRGQLGPAAKTNPGRPYGLVLPPPKPDSPRPFATFTYPEGASDEATLRITYVQHPIPFEAIVAAAQKAGCSKVSMWGGRGGWDEHEPVMDAESEMPCYVLYGRDTEKSVWKFPELYTWC